MQTSWPSTVTNSRPPQSQASATRSPPQGSETCSAWAAAAPRFPESTPKELPTASCSFRHTIKRKEFAMDQVEFKPLDDVERQKLKMALLMNADQGAILRMARDTSFTRAESAMPDDEEVISAIKSVPCHY